MTFRLLIFLNFGFICCVSCIESGLNNCILKVVNEMFTEEDDLTFVYEKNFEPQLPKVLKNPYRIVWIRSNMFVALDKSSGYIIHIENDKSIQSIFGFINDSASLISKKSISSKYLIIVEEVKVKNLEMMFTSLWRLKFTKFVILTFTQNSSFTKLHTSNPFYEENKCGKLARVIQTQDCERHVSIKFEILFRNINGCEIIYYSMDSINLASRVINLLEQWMNVLSHKVNGTLNSLTWIIPERTYEIHQENMITIESSVQNEITFQNYDFSHTVLIERFIFVVKDGGLISALKTLFHIYKVEVWAAIAVAIVVTALSMWILSLLSAKTIGISTLEDITLNVYLSTIWGYFIFVPKNLPARCIFICYLIYHIHIQTGFTSNLASILTTPKFYPGIKNLEELIDSKYLIYGVDHLKNNTFGYEGTPNSTYSEIKSRMRYFPRYITEEKCFELISHGNCSVLIMDYSLVYLDKLIGSTVHFNRIDANLIASSITTVFSLLPGHFFKDTVNAFVMDVRESGISNKVESHHLGVPPLPPVPSETIPLNLTHLSSSFVVLAIVSNSKLLNVLYATFVMVWAFETEYDGYKVYRLKLKNQAQANALIKLMDDPYIDFWSSLKDIHRPVDVMVHPNAQTTFTWILKLNKIDHEVLISDVATYRYFIIYHKISLIFFCRVVRRDDIHFCDLTKMYAGFSFTQYNRFSQINYYLDFLAISYPKLATVKLSGKSYEGRDMKIIKISTNPKANKPVIFVDAGIHGREWLAPAMAQFIMYQLIENPKNRYLLDRVDWHILPVVNPDGYEYTHTKKRFWRKTRSPQGECIGTDGNRNFDFHWGESGSSSNPCSEIYRGPSAFSELETQNVRNHINEEKKRIKLYLTLHSYGKYILYPWGYTYQLPDNEIKLWKLANKVNRAIVQSGGSTYTIGTAANILYPAAGASDDWAKGAAGIEFVYTIELPGGGSKGFNPDPDEILPILQNTFPGFIVFGNYIANNFS
ncbi:hypothetical protein FQR65_LT00948 [Abscondita terminalis]|nr:hypothetical protein FQR65_LT00948 [Abscondita terminalis]